MFTTGNFSVYVLTKGKRLNLSQQTKFIWSVAKLAYGFAEFMRGFVMFERKRLNSIVECERHDVSRDKETTNARKEECLPGKISCGLMDYGGVEYTYKYKSFCINMRRRNEGESSTDFVE